jgi:hypothetical protein
MVPFASRSCTYGSRLARITTRSPCRYRLRVLLSRCGVQAPPSLSDSFSATIRSTSSRTSRRIGWNSGRCVPLRRKPRIWSLQPCQARRAVTTVAMAAVAASRPKASSRKPCVVASRRCTKLRSWTSTTKPSVSSPSATGIALTWTSPPGRAATSLQAVHSGSPAWLADRTWEPTRAQARSAG